MSIRLFRAILKGKYDEAKSAIYRGTVDINALLSVPDMKERIHNRNDVRSYAGYSLLHLAILKGNVSFIEYLLEHGADPNISTRGANIPDTPVLYYAVEMNKAHILQLLIDAGADVNTRSGPYGYTALNQAIMFGNDTAIRILLDNGAHMSTENSFGRTPMKFAEAVENKEAMAIIRAHVGPSRMRQSRIKITNRNRSGTRKSQSQSQSTNKSSNSTIKSKRRRRLSSNSNAA